MSTERYSGGSEGFPASTRNIATVDMLNIGSLGIAPMASRVVTPVVLDGQAAVLWCAASARASAGVRSPSEACGRSLL